MKTKTSRHIVLYVIFTFSIVSFVCTQSVANESNQKTTVPSDSRFEILQSELVARITLKIDKYTGNVYQIVQKQDQSLTWEQIWVTPQKNDKKLNNRVNYQLFASGLAARFTFMININTGVTWQLTEGKSGGLYWAPIE